MALSYLTWRCSLLYPEHFQNLLLLPGTRHHSPTVREPQAGRPITEGLPEAGHTRAFKQKTSKAWRNIPHSWAATHPGVWNSWGSAGVAIQRIKQEKESLIPLWRTNHHLKKKKKTRPKDPHGIQDAPAWRHRKCRALLHHLLNSGDLKCFQFIFHMGLLLRTLFLWSLPWISNYHFWSLWLKRKCVQNQGIKRVNVW